MKLNKSKLALCLLAASTVSVSFASHAAASFSVPDTQTIDINVVAAAGASHISLAQATSLPHAGVLVADSVPVATAINTIIGADPARSGLRYTPNATQVIGGTPDIVTIQGTNANNKLVLKFVNPVDVATWVEFGGDTYYVTTDPVNSQEIVVGLSGAQTITADTYNLAMDGVVYNP